MGAKGGKDARQRPGHAGRVRKVLRADQSGGQIPGPGDHHPLDTVAEQGHCPLQPGATARLDQVFGRAPCAGCGRR
jgi:hypothetical protein